MVGNITLFVLLLTLALYAIGRPMRYRKRKRKRRDAEQFAALALDDTAPSS
jgi:cbb3-type cytochrome oxidase subunit 3